MVTNCNPATEATTPGQLVDGTRLLETLFPVECRPSQRWLRDRTKSKTIPYVRLGRLVFYNPQDVRDAIAKRHTVQSVNR